MSLQALSLFLAIQRVCNLLYSKYSKKVCKELCCFKFFVLSYETFETAQFI